MTTGFESTAIEPTGALYMAVRGTDEHVYVALIGV